MKLSQEEREQLQKRFDVFNQQIKDIPLENVDEFLDSVFDQEWFETISDKYGIPGVKSLHFDPDNLDQVILEVIVPTKGII